MEKLEFSLERRLSIMTEYNLTSNEFDLIQVIFMAQEEEGNSQYLYQWFQIHKSEVLSETLIGLQNKGIILNSYKIPKKGESFSPDDIVFNKNFTKNYLKHSGELGAELFNAYPSFVNINGKAASLKNISKYYQSLDDFFFSYGKAIKFNPVKHNEIIELVEKAKDLNLLHYGILEFVVSQKWLTLEAELENGIMNTNMEVKFEHN